MYKNSYCSLCITNTDYCALIYRARRSEARIQQMVWKVNYTDIVFKSTV